MWKSSLETTSIFLFPFISIIVQATVGCKRKKTGRFFHVWNPVDWIQLLRPTKSKIWHCGFVLHLSYSSNWILIPIIIKSDNLQYNTLVRWVAGMNDSSTKRLMFQALFIFIISYRLRALKNLCFQFCNEKL